MMSKTYIIVHWLSNYYDCIADIQGVYTHGVYTHGVYTHGVHTHVMACGEHKELHPVINITNPVCLINFTRTY